ncbi:MAG: helix-turn-helix transcriptional regulator [Gammaproteobacteria bacterium]|jgi:predicted DNA-binding transcriptional regulator YafY
MLNEIKWATRQRLEYIELMAYYTGLVTRSGVAKAFGISDAAATKDLKLYGDIAPENLLYKHNVFGFVPTAQFKEVFTDLSPATVLPMVEANLAVVGGPDRKNDIFGIPVSSLSLPNRLPDKTDLAQVTRAIHNKRKLKVSYHSLSARTEHEERIIEPHSLVNTGFRWHVRAYNEETFDFRDFVLSRFEDAECLDLEAESSAQYDDDWVEIITLKLSPHPKLDEKNRISLLIDYGSENEIIEIRIRRALIGYLLQQLSVDTTEDHSLNPNKYQLVVLNRDEIEPFASWAFS